MNNEAVPPKNSGLATASLVLGILAVILGIGGVGALLGLLAIIFGAISLKSNKGMALTGIITGTIGILLFIATVVFLFFTINSGNLQTSQRDSENLQVSYRDYSRKNDISMLQSKINHHMSLNEGALPDVNTLNSVTPELTVITESIDSSTGAVPTTSQVVYIQGLSCDSSPGTRNFSLTILLEKGDEYCIGS